jgi:hypothetical protein
MAKPPPDRDDPQAPAVGSEGTRSSSFFELEDGEGKVQLTFPSRLTLPGPWDGEFKEYYLKHDEIRVCSSDSGRTLLIVEDRSPTFPHQAHHLVRFRETDGREEVSWMELRPDYERPPDGMGFGAPYAQPPVVEGLTDDRVVWRLWGRVWNEPLP